MNSPLDQLLYEGLHDWVSLGDVVELVRDGMQPNDEHDLSAALQLVAEALGNGLVQVGAVDGRGFIPWPEQGDDALSRVRGYLESGSHEREGYFECWLANTAAGDARGRRADPH
jgi:hypothetical protein